MLRAGFTNKDLKHYLPVSFVGEELGPVLEAARSFSVSRWSHQQIRFRYIDAV